MSQNRLNTTQELGNPEDSHRSIPDPGEVGPAGPTEGLEELAELIGSEFEGVGLRVASTIVGLSETRAPARKLCMLSSNISSS